VLAFFTSVGIDIVLDKTHEFKVFSDGYLDWQVYFIPVNNLRARWVREAKLE
jgi:hypothetical protein